MNINVINFEDLPKETQEQIAANGVIYALQVIHKANLMLSDVGISAVPTELRKDFSNAVNSLKQIESSLIDML